jgi:hypothetical protein
LTEQPKCRFRNRNFASTVVARRKESNDGQVQFKFGWIEQEQQLRLQEQQQRQQVELEQERLQQEEVTLAEAA